MVKRNGNGVNAGYTGRDIMDKLNTLDVSLSSMKITIDDIKVQTKVNQMSNRRSIDFNRKLIFGAFLWATGVLGITLTIIAAMN